MVLDFSFTRLGVPALKAAGAAGVIRYLAPLPNGKVISKAEYDGYVSTGIPVGLVWEQGTANFLGGAQRGRIDGHEARRQAGELGFPFFRPIYAAYDQNIPRAQFDVARMYQMGFQQGAGVCGCYAEGDLLDALLDSGYANYGWEVNATSWLGSSYDHPRAAIIQRTSHHYGVFASSAYDESTVQHDDWGQDFPPLAVTPPTPLDPPKLTEGILVQALDIQIKTDSTGAGWALTDVPWDSFRGAYTLGSAPDRDHEYWHGEAHGNDTAGKALISVVFCKPNAVAFVRVNVEK